MALVDTVWYANFGNGTSTGYYAITVRPQNTAVTAGQLVRQFTAPTVGNERVFVCIVAGTTANVTDATWVLTRGAKTTDGTATWMECTGQAALNGDLTNTATWAQVKAATPAVLGQVIKRSNNASYQICTTAGAMSASEPTFSDTAGVTTADTAAVWTSLGPVANFTGGQAPHARLIGSLATFWFVAGNTVYIADNHAELNSSALTTGTPTTGSTAATVNRILCHNHSGSYPPSAADLMTGASVSTTGASNLTFGYTLGLTYIYGLTLKSGVGSSSIGSLIIQSSTSGAAICFENCSLQCACTNASATVGITLGSINYSSITLDNSTVSIGNAAQLITSILGQFYWRKTGTVLAGGSAVPNSLLAVIGTSGNVWTAVLEALDLSQITGNIFSNSAATSTGNVLVKDCKLNATATVSVVNSGMTVQLVRSDSGATAYKSARYAYEGTETTETTITRVGGATDPAGQAQSRKIVTATGAQWLRPFKAEPYAVWNATTAANVTVTVYGTINAGAVPNNDDIWLEVEYLGASSSPLGTIATTTKASLLASNAAVASDASTWNGGGSGAGWSPFKLTMTLSSPQPGQAGYIHARVRAAKASATYYIDPQVYLT